ncbi:glycosyltransferase [Serinicoccus profundi]|uniref:glycosyltransferase n=1 Tax=Serinicoccus profundi TaxID=1078471 RepID=UPI000255EA67|nr:glycosyltransferase [Serinicoccus profundi]
MSARDLLVASPGGHVEELAELMHRLTPAPQQPVWVTARSLQTERLLSGEDVEWIPSVGSRQAWRAARSLPIARRLMQKHRPDRVISTGAALALPYLLAARATGARVHYIESATRLHGPSLTGRVLERVPGVHLHHQAFDEPRGRWRATGSVFDSFAPGPEGAPVSEDALLTIGTERFPFTRALSLVEVTDDLSWTVQTGHTPADDADPRCRRWMSPEDLTDLTTRASLVVTHAGVGSVLLALRAGKHPVVVPRLADLREHADDHQLELARALEHRGLVSVLLPDDDPLPVLARARRRSTVRVRPEPVSLEG